MANTNQLKRGGKLLLNGAKALGLFLNITLGLAGDLDEWLKETSPVWQIVDANNLKKCTTSTELAAEVRSFLIARFREVVIYNRKIEDLNETELERLVALEVEMNPKFTNHAALKHAAFNALMKELDS